MCRRCEGGDVRIGGDKPRLHDGILTAPAICHQERNRVVACGCISMGGITAVEATAIAKCPGIVKWTVSRCAIAEMHDSRQCAHLSLQGIEGARRLWINGYNRGH